VRRAGDERPETIVDIPIHFGVGYRIAAYLHAEQRYAESSGC
jgi:hypothetical protein